MRKKIIFILVVVIILVAGYLIFFKDNSNESKQKKTGPGGSGLAKLSDEESSKYTINNQASVYYIVNKKRSVASGYVPENLVTVEGKQLRSDAGSALIDLLNAASNEGVNLKIISGYRSYATQSSVYNSYVAKDGQAKADTYSARPGHSEHQTGLAADLGTGVCDLQICFGDTKGGRWLEDNAHNYGFVIRYQKAKEHLSGYQYEPWHVRYVGKDLAKKLHDSDQTMEQFFGLPPAQNY